VDRAKRHGKEHERSVQEPYGASCLLSLVVHGRTENGPLANESIGLERGLGAFMTAGRGISQFAISFAGRGSIFPTVESELLCRNWAEVGNSLFSAREVYR
jgi:hypothetical protein